MVMGAEHMFKFAVLSLTVENMFEKNEKPYPPPKKNLKDFNSKNVRPIYC